MNNAKHLLETSNNPSTPDSGRVDWIDYVKGIGIVLVVYGHVLFGITNSGVVLSATVPLQLFIQNSLAFIYTFHMALFFFLSGLVVARSLSKTQKKFKELFLSKVKTIAYPYLIWSLIQGIIAAYVSPYANNTFAITDIPFRILFLPIAQFWFLYTLFICHIVFSLMQKVIKLNNYFIFFISVVMYLISPYIDKIYVLSCFNLWLVYFVLGVISARFLYQVLKKISAIQALLISLICFCVQAYIFFYTSVILKFDFILKLHVNQNLGLAFFMALLGTIATICLSFYLSKIKAIDIIRYLGSLSMPIYLAHLLASAGARIFLQKVLHLNNLVLHVVVETVVGLIFPIVLYEVAQKNRFPYLFSLGNRSSLSPAPLRN